MRRISVSAPAISLMPGGKNVQYFGNVLEDIGSGAAMQVALSVVRMPAGVFGWGGAAGTGMWVEPINRLHIVLTTQYMPAEINSTLREDPASAVYANLGLWPSGERILPAA
ncbi:hypothetical protein [Sphingomonas jatrophae]|uniref:hypothetical protein n=1 Tax=Sphingomonas jatrophae TaxID=1166337 RepID=UPI00104202CC|nr:hypothetical protein [Sphingomonas jatrophae]